VIAEAWLDGWGVLVWLASAAFWILVIAGIVVLLRSHTGSGASRGALQILEERYARGEIPREEFLERRSVLTKAPPEGATAPRPDEPPADPTRDTKPLDPSA
jgi:putative membrane protein